MYDASSSTVRAGGCSRFCVQIIYVEVCIDKKCCEALQVGEWLDSLTAEPLGRRVSPFAGLDQDQDGRGCT